METQTELRLGRMGISVACVALILLGYAIVGSFDYQESLRLRHAADVKAYSAGYERGYSAGRQEGGRAAIAKKCAPI